MSTETAAAAVAVAPASSFVTQSGPTFLVSLLTIGFGPGPDWPPVAPGVDAAVLAVIGKGIAVVGTNPVVAAVEAENGHPT